MRSSTLLLALPALAAAQGFQHPLLDQAKNWFAKASESVSSLVASATDSVAASQPLAPVAAKLANLNVNRLTVENHKELLQPGAATAHPSIEQWLIFVTGGNKTCYGLCGAAETAWNESVALLATSRNPPNLALLNCETDGVLCHAWYVSPPQLLHIQLPQPLVDQTAAATTFRAIPVNRTTITAPQLAAVHLEEKYLETAPYEGFWHPFDGPLAKNGLNIPFGYVLWGFSQVPSWMFMLLVSFLSRNMMSRRMGPQRAGEAPAAAPAAAPAS